MSFDILKIRQEFPILEREVRPGVKLVYLDSTATAQKPLSVIDAMDEFYRKSNANIHRGVHTLAVSRLQNLSMQPLTAN
jgi:cysteine desulfurase/selenocysteine lyase